MEFDGADSLFEGMVLFSPSELAADVAEEVAIGSRIKATEVEKVSDVREEITDTKLDNNHVHQPLDESLFSDLTLNSANEKIPAVVEASDVIQTDAGAMRKKKKAVSRRIGYARDTILSSPEAGKTTPSLVVALATEQSDCETAVSATNLGKEDSIGFNRGIQDSSTTASPASEGSYATPLRTEDSCAHDTTHDSVTESQLERLKSWAASEVELVRKQCASVSASQKDAHRRRRKVEEDLRSATAHHQLLESQLQDACEREDFEAAQRISDSLATSDDHRRILLGSLTDSKTLLDAMDSQMHEALLGLIAVEQQCASRFSSFSHDVEQNVQSLATTSTERFSKHMDSWSSSSEVLHITEIALGIESYLLDELRSTLTDSINEATAVDQREKDTLCRKKDSLSAELHDLLALARKKEAEITEMDCEIKHIDERIANVVGEFQQIQLVIDSKHDNLQFALSEIQMQSKTLSSSKSAIDDMLVQDQSEVSKLKQLCVASQDEAESYEEVVKMRKCLQLSISKSREQKTRLADVEEKLIREVQELQHELVTARGSLQELTSIKSSIHQRISSYNQRLFFVDKRIPELEAEKRVAAAARNFGEAARITADAKMLNLEKEELLKELEKETAELRTLEQTVKDTASKLNATEELMHAKDKEVAMARFQMLRLSVVTATTERCAALELGDTEEADLLLVEIEAATSESMELETKYGFKEENFSNLPKHSISLELVASLGKEELSRLADLVVRSSS